MQKEDKIPDWYMSEDEFRKRIKERILIEAHNLEQKLKARKNKNSYNKSYV